MPRLVGVLVGAALAIAVLITLVGLPQPAPMGKGPEPSPGESREMPVAAQPARPDGVSVAGEPQAGEPEHAATIPADAVLPTSVEAKPEPRPQAGTLRWHAFWSPFRSRIAANGFVEQLQRVTGLDYRVVNVRPGVYEVAFAYTEDADIAANLAQISAATGLDVPGS